MEAKYRGLEITMTDYEINTLGAAFRITANLCNTIDETGVKTSCTACPYDGICKNIRDANDNIAIAEEIISKLINYKNFELIVKEI